MTVFTHSVGTECTETELLVSILKKKTPDEFNLNFSYIEEY